MFQLFPISHFYSLIFPIPRAPPPFQKYWKGTLQGICLVSPNRLVEWRTGSKLVLKMTTLTNGCVWMAFLSTSEQFLLCQQGVTGCYVPHHQISAINHTRILTSGDQVGTLKQPDENNLRNRLLGLGICRTKYNDYVSIQILTYYKATFRSVVVFFIPHVNVLLHRGLGVSGFCIWT